MFAYCLNNPIVYVDSSGYRVTAVPFIENGLNLPAEGGIPVSIDGVTYYYAIYYNRGGELYEYWFDCDGNLIHVRHHSTHGNSGIHDDPHDHTGYRDDKGNNTHTKGPEPVDDNFKSPNQQMISNPSIGLLIPQVAPSRQSLSRPSWPRGSSSGSGMTTALVATMFVGGLFCRYIMTTSRMH